MALLVAAALVAIAAINIVGNINQERETHRREVQSAGEAIKREQESRFKAEELQKATQQQLDAEKAKSKELEGKNEQLERDLQAKAESKRQAAIAAANSKRMPATVAFNQPTATPPVGCLFYRPLVAQYNWNVDTMMRIMNAESSCNPVKHNHADNHRTCLGSYGLFQIGCVHGVTAAQMSDPAANIAKAYAIFLSQGYTAWSTY